MKTEPTYLLRYPLHGRKVNIVLLNDTGIERVEIHNQNELVPQATLGFKHQSALVFVSFTFAGFRPAALTVGVIGFGLNFWDFFPKGLVGADVLEFVELMEQNVFVTFRTSTIQGLVPKAIVNVIRLRWVYRWTKYSPSVPSKIRKLSRQR